MHKGNMACSPWTDNETWGPMAMWCGLDVMDVVDV